MLTFVKYEKNKIFIILTSILIVSIFVLIRECDYPLLIDLPLFSRLFIHQYPEKLFYNISISYIVTYIFYIIQLYIPATIRNHNAIKILRPSIYKEINYLKYALCILDASTYTQDEYRYIKQDLTLPLYIIVDKNDVHYLRRFSYGETLIMLRDAFSNIKNSINNSTCLHDLDSYIATILTNLPTENLFSILEQIETNLNSKYTFKFSNYEISSKLIKQINKLEHIPGLIPNCHCSISNNDSLHSQYDNELSNGIHNEFVYTINISL